MRRLLDPIFSLENSALLNHRSDVLEGMFGETRARVHFDRSIQKAAKSNASTAGSVAGTAGANASQIASTIIPGLERDSTNPTGFTATQKNNQLVAGAEGVGGVGSGVTGTANLLAARTRNAGGFTGALDEAARIKSRQLSANALGVNNADAMLAQKKQQQARQMLAGLYGTDTSNQLKAMGLQNEDENTALNAGKSGWLQNTLDTINTLNAGGKTAADMKNAGLFG